MRIPYAGHAVADTAHPPGWSGLPVRFHTHHMERERQVRIGFSTEIPQKDLLESRQEFTRQDLSVSVRPGILQGFQGP